MDTHPSGTSGELEHESVPETSPSAEQTSIPDTCRAKTREKRLNSSMYHLMIDDEAFGLWRQVAAERKLVTDTQVASFLLQHYHRTPTSYCCICHSPLTLSCVSCASTQENLNAGIPDAASRSHQGVSVGQKADDIDDAIRLRTNAGAFPPPKSATMNEVAAVGKLSEAEDDSGDVDVGLKDTRAGNEESNGQAFIRRRSTRKRAPTKRVAEMTDDVEKVLQKLISGQETLAYTDASSTESEEYQLYLRLMSKLEMLPDSKGHRSDPDFVIDDSRKVKTSGQPKAKRGKRGQPKAAAARSKLNPSGQPQTVAPKSKLARTRSRSELAKTRCKGVKSAVVKSDNPKLARVRHRGFPQSIERKYKCEKCRSSFFGSNDLRRHMRTHTGEKPYVCEKCGAAFALASTLKRHNMGHSATRPFRCLECGSAFYSAAYLQKHERVHTGDRPYLCDECGAAFIQPGNLQTHIKKNHTGDMPYTCQTCCARFKTANHLEIHARVHKGPDPYQCTECGAGFPSYMEMKEHKRTHIGRCELKCGQCGEIFKTSKLLTLHMETHGLDADHPSARDTYHHEPLQTAGADKDLCLLQTNSHQSDSSQHEGNKFVKCSDPNVIIPLQDENSGGMFVCNVCSAVLPSVDEWRQHTRTHNQSYTQSGSHPKTHVCPNCHSTFKTATKLKEHIRIHTGEKPFLCKQCNAAFSNVTNLKAHTRTHTGFRPYVCKTCNASFTISSNLKTHMRVHTGERPYGCGQCSLAFTQRASLRRHMRTHTGDRPYMCEQCSACFMAPSNLKRHMKTHTLAGRKATTCEKCSAQFFVPANMQTGKECSVPLLCRQCSSSLISTHNIIAASVPSVLAPSNPTRFESRQDTRDKSRHEIRIPNVLSASISGAISASSDCTALNPKNQAANSSMGEPAMGPTMGLRNVLQSSDVVRSAIDTVVSMGSNADVPVALDSSHMQVIKITLETLYNSR